MSDIKNRYEFLYLFDVEDGNPNGDPDAGNMPRLDPETNLGLVTDVCLKRKIRNYVQILKNESEGFKLYVKEKAVLNRLHDLAYKNNPDIEKPKSNKLPAKEEEALKITGWMCANFFDIRAFGAVMTTEINCGQVRGPVQINFAKSINQIMPMEHSITRMAVTNEKDLEKERTIGRKFTVPYALYKAEGYVSPFLAAKTGFSEEDLEILWDSLINMFDHDHSAARGKMSARKLFVFKHSSALGNAPANILFDAVKIERKEKEDKPVRHFSDYNITVDKGSIPGEVEIIEKL